MKTNRQVSTWILALVLSSSSALGWSLQSTPSQDSGAKQDMKDAGHDTKNAVKSAGRGTKKAYHATKNGTKKAWNKTKSTTKGAVDGGKAGAKEPPQ